jgi:hypothetical protein
LLFAKDEVLVNCSIAADTYSSTGHSSPKLAPQFQGRNQPRLAAGLHPNRTLRHLDTLIPRYRQRPIEPQAWLPTRLQMCGVSAGALISFLRSSLGDPWPLTFTAEATREEMRDAKLPLAYRDSCAHLLIPLNKCRRETWYAPWKCSVRSIQLEAARDGRRGSRKLWEPTNKIANLSLPGTPGRATQLRKVPVRRIQEASRQDERAAGVKRGCAKQLRRCWEDEETKCTYCPWMRNGNRTISRKKPLNGIRRISR